MSKQTTSTRNTRNNGKSGAAAGTSSKKNNGATQQRRTSTKAQQESLPTLTLDQKLDIIGVALLALAALTLLSLLSARQGSLTGMWVAMLSDLLGWGKYVAPFFIGAVGLWLILRRFGDRIPWPEPEQVVGVVLAFVVSLATLHGGLHWAQPHSDLYALARDGQGGGLIGAALLDLGLQSVGPAGVGIILLIMWLIILTFIAGISPADAIRLLAQRQAGIRRAEVDAWSTEDDADTEAFQMPLSAITLPVSGPPEPESPPTERDTEVVANLRPKRKKDAPPDVTIHVAARPMQRANGNGGNITANIETPAVGSQAWRLPVLAEVLEQGSEQSYNEDLIRKQVRIIEETLESLGAPVKVKEINRGPVVTQFGAEPLFLTSRAGKQTKVKVGKIASLADDVALALSAKSIRIQAPIPGKGLVGIEVPNEKPALVSLRDIMEAEEFAKLKGQLRLGMGQDVSGQAVVGDMRAMPHLLIAGSTGSGKSVCVNAIIAALLMQNTPDTLRLLMVDPKRVELTQYNGIPHLLSPVVVDVERVVPALRWVMREMDNRYRRFAQIGARNIQDFNRKVIKQEDESPIPYIVVLIDELADLMMQAPEETERVLCRLAQMARATGIHLVIATQRPSVDVVTGLIKANFPARVAFAVASSVDSRVILDTPGAERLLGRGDMLFMPPDVSQPMRLQGAHVSDRELDRLIQFWHSAVEPGNTAVAPVMLSQSAPELQEAVEQPAMFPEFEEVTSSEYDFDDKMLPTAVEIFLAENRASVSLLQRRLRIGYTRSARLVETLTEMGVVTLETEGQFRKVNRAVAEALLQSLHPDAPTANDAPPFDVP